MTVMEQLIEVMTQNIKELVEDIIYIENNHYLLILTTGENIYFTKE